MSRDAPRPPYSSPMVSPNRPSFFIPSTICGRVLVPVLEFGRHRDDLPVDEVPDGGQDVLLELGQAVGLREASHGVLPQLSSSSRAAGLLAAALLDVGLGRHHDLAAEHADQGAVLLVAAGLDLHHAPVAAWSSSRLPSTVVSP